MVEPSEKPVELTKSKNQLKREAKEKMWLEQRDEYKQKLKEKKKANPPSRKDRFTHLKGIESDIQGKGKKKDLENKYKELVALGRSIVIDCEFEDYMDEKQIKSISQQVAYCYSQNKRILQGIPFRLTLTGIGPKLTSELEKLNYQNWAVHPYKESHRDVFEKSKDKLVYLTADSPNLIESLDHDKIYVIGGIVDHNQHKLLTFNKAYKEGISHARLPIKENITMNSSVVLTVDHIFSVLCHFEKEQNWEKALKLGIPGRKINEGVKKEPVKKEVLKSEEKVEELKEK